jgi:formate dehydrogenase assembly factor FdhD
LAVRRTAVEFAVANGQVLVGFLRGERMNVYAGTLAE